MQRFIGCYQCKVRYPGCHTYCESYKKAKEEYQEEKDEKQRQAQEQNAVLEITLARNRRTL